MRVLVVGAGALGGYFGGRLSEAGRDDALERAARAGIERQVAGGAEAAEHVHIEKGDTMWSLANRVLDAVQDEEKKGREP